MRSKYNAKKTEVDGILFDSRKEANYYRSLMQQKADGEVLEVKRQVTFTLQPSFAHNGKLYRPITYRADFLVLYADGHSEVIDVKGFRTKEYKIKMKMLLFRFPGISFKEV